MRKKQLLATGAVTPSRALLGLIILTILFGAALARADDPNRVGLLVVHGDGSLIKQCIEFSGDEISGYEVLERSGLDLNADVSNGMGAAICRIDNEGCTYPEKDCFCQCQGSATCIFWSYWLLSGNEWQFSGMGASSFKVKNGDVQGWVWGAGSPTGGGSPPPTITFEEICASSPTDTPIPTATDTPVPTDTPTHTPEPTNTPEPTDTPTPEPTPIIHHFTTDRIAINAGESVTLSWDLSEAEAAYLRYDGNEEGVISPGSKTVSPTQTTVYTLVARNDGGEASVEVTITVSGSPPAPTSTPTPLPTATPAPSTQTTAVALPPTETPVPEPVIHFRAGAPTLPVGACTTLHWEVQNASTVYLDGVEVEAQASMEACPEQSRAYTLRVLYPGGEHTAQLTLEVVDDSMAISTDTPSVTATTPLAVKPTASPTQPLAEATSVSQKSAPTVEIRPVKRNPLSPPQPSSSGERSWSLAKLGIWGGLVGGWCLIATVALMAWTGFWWLNNRKVKN